MTVPTTCRRPRRGLAVVVAVGCLVTTASSAARCDEPPGPVPLVQDAGPEPAARRPPSPAGLGDWRLVAALGAVVAVLGGARLAASRRALPPPPDVFEVLGSASLGGQHAVRIVRFGPKTLLVGVSSAGATTLAEIGDPQSTARIAAACRGAASPPRDRARPAAPAPAARVAAAEAL